MTMIGRVFPALPACLVFAFLPPVHGEPLSPSMPTKGMKRDQATSNVDSRVVITPLAKSGKLRVVVDEIEGTADSNSDLPVRAIQGGAQSSGSITTFPAIP